MIEARRMMLEEGRAISLAAYAVGYESVPQFTRKYGRMFGLPAARDMKVARMQRQAAAWRNRSLLRLSSAVELQGYTSLHRTPG